MTHQAISSKIQALVSTILRGFDLDDKFGDDIDTRHSAELDGVSAAGSIPQYIDDLQNYWEMVSETAATIAYNLDETVYQFVTEVRKESGAAIGDTCTEIAKKFVEQFPGEFTEEELKQNHNNETYWEIISDQEDATGWDDLVIKFAEEYIEKETREKVLVLVTLSYPDERLPLGTVRVVASEQFVDYWMGWRDSMPRNDQRLSSFKSDLLKDTGISLEVIPTVSI